MEFKKHLTFAAYHHYILSQLNTILGPQSCSHKVVKMFKVATFFLLISFLALTNGQVNKCLLGSFVKS